jgi:hypothetical protein
MAIWTKDGTLKVDGSGKVITCATCPCTTSSCNQECCDGGKWPDQINCDIGVLGWVDGGCSECDTLGGVYVLNADTLAGSWNPNSNCIWKYDSGELCTFLVASCGRTARARLQITATLTTTCDWTVLVSWSHAGLDDSCPNINKSGTYFVDNSGGGDCDGLELDLIGEISSDNTSCTGTFPATIELSR